MFTNGRQKVFGKVVLLNGIFNGHITFLSFNQPVLKQWIVKTAQTSLLKHQQQEHFIMYFTLSSGKIIYMYVYINIICMYHALTYKVTSW